MLIYFNGDGNTAGSELEPGQCYADILTQHFQATAVNHALIGCSNDHILRSTTQYIEQCKQSQTFPDLVIIGWTEWWRQDWRKDGKHVPVIKGFVNFYDLNQVETDRLEYHNNIISKYFIYASAMAVYYNNAIYNLHCELQELGIKHLFFNEIGRAHV